MLQQRRIFCVFLLLVAMCPAFFAQTAPLPDAVAVGDSGVKVVKSRWYRHVVMMTSSPMSAATATMGVPASSSLPMGTFIGSRRGFMYEAKIKNESGREIKGLHWDHVFLDPKGEKELRRFHFVNDRRSIGKGKTVTLERMSGHPPSPTIDVGMLEKGAPPYVERIDIKCVLFKGDVFWQAAEASNAECAYLRRKNRQTSK